MTQQMGQKLQKEQYQLAQMFVKKGEFQSAENVCTSMLKHCPDDANFLCLSAQALIQLKHLDSANTRIEHALSLFPRFDRVFDVRGDLLVAQDDLAAAVEAFKQVLKLNPKRQQTRIKLGQILLHLGRLEEVDVLRDEFFGESQNNKLIDKATQLEKEEKFEEAERIYREILLQEPDNVTVMRLWAGLGIKQKRFSEAEPLLRRAVEKAPDFNQAWHDLFTVQYEQEKHTDAIKSAIALTKLKPNDIKPRVMLASAHAGAGEHQMAVQLFDKALEIAPGYVGALCSKGNSCRTIGDQEGAIAAFRKSIEVNPLHTEPYWSLANLKTFRFEQSEVENMLALVKDERITPEGQVHLYNALGHEFHARGDYEQSFELIDKGNKQRREQEFYDSDVNEAKVNQTIEVFSKQFINNSEGYGDPDPSPIFIVGLPRSGSTLIEQILASHSKVEGTYELHDLALTIREIPEYPERGLHYPKTLTNINHEMFKSFGADYIQRTCRVRSELPFFTDKNPNNFMHAGLLHLILPNAKIINARRHPLDSCFGSYRQLFASGQPFTYDLIDLGEYYMQYQHLMDHWHQVLPGKVLDVNYEEVVADTENQIRRILNHCKLDWEDNCLNFHETNRAVKTASSEQVRKPIYASSVNSWRCYETHLGDLIEVLEPLLAKLPESDRPISLGGSC
ncbi:MAG: tetratricopeptide repeat protein [Gammaproteobacteria bacterium]|nr:tetratricopeptide repeat protein [Gammaproteobacteria bacterium]